MALYIKDDLVDQLAHQLKEQIGGTTTKTDAVRIALQHELERRKTKISLRDRIAAVRAQARLTLGEPGHDVDIKSVMDDLWDGAK